LVGTFTGVLLGVAGGAAAGNALVPNDASQFALVLGGIVGAVVGGFIGYQIGKGFDTIVFGMRWVEVPLSRVRWETRGFRDAAPSASRSRELALTLSVSVRH
jgi:membrane protein YqaA with SNARE-associated domain